MNKNLKIHKDTFLFNSFMDNFLLYSNKIDTKATVINSADKSQDYVVVMSVLEAVIEAGLTEDSLAING